MRSIRVSSRTLVLLVGLSGSGKSTFARRHFGETETVSSDHLRSVVSDSSANQLASNDAFDLARRIVSMRLARRRLTVFDATNLEAEYREPFVQIARRRGATPVAIVFDLGFRQCWERNRTRSNPVPNRVMRQQVRNLAHTLKMLPREVDTIYHLRSAAEISLTRVVPRRPSLRHRLSAL